MGLLVLNDDVLLDIFSRLHGKDALNVALTARRIHELAIHRVAARSICEDGKQLCSLHRYILHGSRPRAQYLESLTITDKAWIPATETMTVNYPWVPNPSHIQLVLDLLVHASNLRKLYFADLHSISESNPRLISAICALPLQVASFSGVGNTAAAFLRGLSPHHLRTLTLYFGDIDYAAEEEDCTYPTLLTTLAALPSLETLRLAQFRCDASIFNPENDYTPPLLPSLRNLTLRYIRLAGLDIVSLCPNLVSLSYGPISNVQSRLSNDPTSPTPRFLGALWPPLRSLSTRTSELAYAEPLLNNVHYLIVQGFINSDLVHGAVESPERLKSVLQRTSPVGLHIFARLAPTPLTFWATIAESAPNLRFLELKLNITMCMSSDRDKSLYSLPGLLSPLSKSLVSVYILLPVSAPDAAVTSTHKEMRQVIPWRALQDLPQCLADALPSLRFVGIYVVGVNSAPVPFQNRTVHATSNFPVTYPARGKEHEDPEEARYSQWWEQDAQTMNESRGTVYRHWWRVRVSTDNGDGARSRRLEAMSEAGAQRLQSFMRNANVEQLSRIEDFFQ